MRGEDLIRRTLLGLWLILLAISVVVAALSFLRSDRVYWRSGRTAGFASWGSGRVAIRGTTHDRFTWLDHGFTWRPGGWSESWPQLSDLAYFRISTMWIPYVAAPAWAPIVLLATSAWLFSRPLHRARRRERHRHGLCIQCGYDLTGNESGVWPECGTKTEKPPVQPDPS